MKLYNDCDVIVYRCTMCPKPIEGRPHFAIDCERHMATGANPLFAGAIGMAMMHRGEARLGRL